MKSTLAYFNLLFFCCLPVLVQAQVDSIGVFSHQQDIGKGIKQGTAKYSPASGQYLITASGNKSKHDSQVFHYVYRKLKGDFIVYARLSSKEKENTSQSSMGWMIRQSLDANAPYVSVSVNAERSAALQFRRNEGADRETISAQRVHADILELERKGKTYMMRIAKYGEPFVTQQVTDLDLGDEVYVGLFVAAGPISRTESGRFRDIRITIPYTGDPDKIFQMKLGSNLEVLDVATGDRRIVYHVPYSIQAPNWLKDGRTLLFNKNDGLMYLFDLESSKTKRLNTGKVNQNNNDHVLSFDGQMLGLSSYSKEAGGSVIYTVPVTGGTPQQITSIAPSYLHGWSPDGKDLVFCGSRNDEFDVYKIPAKGGEEIRLTQAKGLDDGPEYSPDGKYIYFNSVRTGTMQIWRMKPDGSEQEQVTDDSFNNWFPHISPDGKWIVFLSFLKDEVAPGSHPPYKHVYIRLMPVNGGRPRVLAYLYGGQGSMNTPCWSPDSKKIAFISNTGTY